MQFEAVRSLNTAAPFQGRRLPSFLQIIQFPKLRSFSADAGQVHHETQHPQGSEGRFQNPLNSLIGRERCVCVYLQWLLQRTENDIRQLHLTWHWETFAPLRAQSA